MSNTVTALRKRKADPQEREIRLEQISGHDPLAATLDFPGNTQIRAGTDNALVERYAALIADGVALPPVIVVEDAPGSYLLADGHHRVEARWTVHALNPAMFPATITAIVHQGGYPEAIRIAIEANRAHGKNLSDRDLEQSYLRACEVGLIEPRHSVEKTQALLGCPRRTAERLTEANREKYIAERNALILSLDLAGETQKAIAEKVGLTQPRVAAVLKEYKLPPVAETYNEPEPEQDPEPEPELEPEPDPKAEQERQDRAAAARAQALAEARRARAERLKQAPEAEAEEPEGIYPLPEPPPVPFTRPKADASSIFSIQAVFEQIDALPDPSDALWEADDDDITADVQARLERCSEWLADFNAAWLRKWNKK
jgi:ParB-like chromosome segregation protein Spo0J